jgi:hypothetical protein
VDGGVVEGVGVGAVGVGVEMGKRVVGRLGARRGRCRVELEVEGRDGRDGEEGLEELGRGSVLCLDLLRVVVRGMDRHVCGSHFSQPLLYHARFGFAIQPRRRPRSRQKIVEKTSPYYIHLRFHIRIWYFLFPHVSPPCSATLRCCPPSRNPSRHLQALPSPHPTHILCSALLPSIAARPPRFPPDQGSRAGNVLRRRR